MSVLVIWEAKNGRRTNKWWREINKNEDGVEKVEGRKEAKEEAHFIIFLSIIFVTLCLLYIRNTIRREEWSDKPDSIATKVWNTTTIELRQLNPVLTICILFCAVWDAFLVYISLYFLFVPNEMNWCNSSSKIACLYFILFSFPLKLFFQLYVYICIYIFIYTIWYTFHLMIFKTSILLNLYTAEKAFNFTATFIFD